MAKRKPKGKNKRREKEPVPISEYRDGDGNVLTLRDRLSAGSIAKLGSAPSPERAATSQEDAWQRREESLFERLAVRWEISGMPIDDQKMLLGRYRMASTEERRWVRETIASHLERHIPELRG